MSVYDDASAFRKAILGLRADKATGTVANGTTSLFTIGTGRILLTSLVGRVTTAIGSTVSNCKLVYNPTAAGTSFDMCTAVAITSDAVEQTYTILGNTETVGALLVAGAVGQCNPVFEDGYLLRPGAIEQNLSADPVGGAITWSVTWIPYDVGATLVAA